MHFLVNNNWTKVTHDNIKTRYFIKDQQKAWNFVHYSQYLYHSPYLLCNSNNKPFFHFKDLSQSLQRVGINLPLV